MNRLVHINPIEPSGISGSTPAGFDCRIDLVYRTAIDITLKVDPSATLVLTGRTSNRSASYLVPATDIVNGKARVVIPGGDLSDPNGYDMTLVGTIDGGRKVLATGILKLTNDGMPDVAAADVIDQIPLLLTRGVTAELVVNMWTDESKSVGYSIAGSIVAAAVYAASGGPAIASFTVAAIDTDSVSLTMDAIIVDTLPDACWWSLTISSGTGTTTLAQGPVTVQDAP